MENKKTNRNTKLIILAIVLALVVLFLCIGGSTFARYISSKNVPANQATVAKWGYIVIRQKLFRYRNSCRYYQQS